MNLKIKKLYSKYEEIINYIIVGAFTTLVSLLSYYLVLLFTNYMIATIISWICAVIFAFIFNRKNVFKSSNLNIKEEFVKFVGSRLFTLLVEMIIMYLLVDIINISEELSKIVLQFITLTLNYILSKLFVFKNKEV